MASGMVGFSAVGTFNIAASEAMTLNKRKNNPRKATRR
jgi:hypothetical protein